MTAQEYNTCVQLYSDNVFRFIAKQIGRKADAEDIVQNAFEKLWQQHPRIVFETAKSYLFTTAYHCLIDWLRTNKRYQNQEELPEIIGNQNHSHNYELKELLEKGLQSLSEVQKSVLLLRDYEGYNYEEIGRITGLNESQVKVYIFRARQKLQAFINTENNPTP